MMGEGWEISLITHEVQADGDSREIQRVGSDFAYFEPHFSFHVLIQSGLPEHEEEGEEKGEHEQQLCYDEKHIRVLLLQFLAACR